MIKKIIFCFLTSSSLLGTAQAALPNFGDGNYVFFGDSLTDVGNKVESPESCVNVSAPVTNHTTGTGGNYANITWANSGPFGTVTASNAGGNDYAVSGYVSSQVYATINSYVSHNNVSANKLYAIWFGSNDLIDAISTGNATNVATAIKNGMTNMVASVSRLYLAGARNFLIIGVPDISKTPLVTYPHPDPLLYLGLLAEGQAALQQACTTWNNLLFATSPAPGSAPLKYLKDHLPGIHIYIWNPMPLMESIVANPSSYNYPNQLTFNTIIGQAEHIADANYDNNQVTYCGNSASAADTNPDHYIFYNFIHPTAYTHHLLGQAIAENATEFS